MRMHALVSSALVAMFGAGLSQSQDYSPASLQAEAETVAELCDAPAVVDWLERSGELPTVTPAVLHVGPRKPGGFDRVVMSESEFESASEEERQGLQRVAFGSERYYATFYGTPIGYAPALNAVAAAGVESFEGMKVLDFGYGQLGQLEMLARCGAEVHGVEVDPIVHRLYTETEADRSIESGDGREGSIGLHFGEWFGDEQVRASTGDEFDLILMRNVLKKGYVTPEVPMPGFDSLNVGGSPEQGAVIVAEALAPGGIAIVYNLGGGHWFRDDGSYNNAADVRDPFGREAWEAAGLEVLEFEVNGSELLREVGVRLGWGESVDELSTYNVLYTIVRKSE